MDALYIHAMNADGIRRHVGYRDLLDRDRFTCSALIREVTGTSSVLPEGSSDMLIQPLCGVRNRRPAYEAYFAGICQLGMKDRSLIDKINSTFIVLCSQRISAHRWSYQWVFLFVLVRRELLERRRGGRELREME